MPLKLKMANQYKIFINDPNSQSHMTHILQVQPGALIEQASKQLKAEKIVTPPEWSDVVKTGCHKERMPDSPDWWYVRCAAVLRAVAKLGPVGTEKLRTKFGGKKDRGHKPERFCKGSGSILRKALQQLEEADFVKKAEKGAHKGRVLTPKGISFLDKIAMQIIKESRAQ